MQHQKVQCGVHAKERVSPAAMPEFFPQFSLCTMLGAQNNTAEKGGAEQAEGAGDVALCAPWHRAGMWSKVVATSQ